MPGRYKMSEKKNIDRLFQEKFKDFEATPNEAVWRNISARLQEKERRRPLVAPIWSRVAGIAAVFALIFFIGDWMFPVSGESIAVKEEMEGSYEDSSFPIADNSTSKVPAQIVEENTAPVIEKKTKTSAKITQDQKVIPLNTTLSEESISSSEKTIASSKALNTPSRNESLPKKKSLFDEIREQEVQIAEEGSKGNFEVSTHAAPIYYGNFGSGSFLDPQFKDNSKESEITYSYGINIAYSISDKIKIRSGVNKVSMSYNTNNIAYSAIVGPSAINAVAMNDDPNADAAAKESSISKRVLQNTTKTAIGSVNSGLLNQKLGFIEVPVELEYNLINKRFELNIIGGASTLFLDENKISVNTGINSAVGRAKNLNQVSFSTNIGLGLDYNLSEKFKLNMEPMLKYQFNTFNSQSSGNQPYYLGIYSGFSFKF